MRRRATPEAPTWRILSEGIWRESFHADPSIVGRTVRIGGRSCTIIGVMPASFSFPDEMGPDLRKGLWLPLQPTPEMLKDRGYRFFNIVAAMRPGATVAQVQQELNAIAAHIPHDTDEPPAAFRTALYHETITGPVRPVLLALLAALGLVLLIACANVSNILIARCLARQQEFAVRSALGAGRMRLVRQLLAEGLTLSLLGCGVGVLLAEGAMTLIRKLPQGTIPRADSIAIHWTVVLVLAAIAIVVTVLSSLLPALLVARAHPQAALQIGFARRGLTDGKRQAQRNPGGRRSGALHAAAGGRRPLVPHALEPGTGAAGLRRGKGDGVHRHARRCCRLFRHDGFARHSPRAGFRGHAGLPAHPRPDAPRAGRGRRRAHYFAAAFRDGGAEQLRYRGPAQGQYHSAGNAGERGERRLHGRDEYAHSARAHGRRQRCVLYSVCGDREPGLREEILSGQEPLGKQISLGGADTGMVKPFTIVGVFGDQAQRTVGGDILPSILLPMQQVPTTSLFYQALLKTVVTFVVKTRGDIPVEPEMRALFHRDARGFALDDFETMQAAVEKNTFGKRLGLYLIGSFAGLAVVMVIAGLYGVLSQLVSYRRREIGVRMALGATRRSVAELVLRQGSILVGSGLVAGLLLALAGGRLVKSFLYQVKPLDAWTYAAVALALCLIGLLASLLPARRAATIEPMQALREE